MDDKMSDFNINEIEGYVTPQDIDAERAVLGACLMYADAVDVTVEALPKDLEVFYAPIHQIIYRAILELYGESKPIDIITVTKKIKDFDTGIEGIAYEVTTLTIEVVSDINASAHVGIVLQTYIARLLIISNRESITKLYESEDPLETLDREYKKLEGIHGMIDKKQSKSLSAIVDENLAQARHAMTLDDNVTGVPTGFKELDRATAGFQKSELIILAARPGMGKSGLMLSMAQSMAQKGFKVAIFSLEMSERQLVVRMQSSEAEINLESINSGRISNHEYKLLEHKSKNIKALPIHIFDKPGMNLLELKSKCNQIKKKLGLDMVFVDYLQLMSGDKGKNNREQEIGMLSRGLKGLAKELDLPVIALSQLSRAVESRGGDKTPQLSDLRESGSIEQDADMVMFLYRAEYYNITEDAEGNPTTGVAKLIIAKHRQGRLLDVYMRFIAKFVKFTDLEQFGDVSETNKELAERYSVKSPEKDIGGDVPWD